MFGLSTIAGAAFNAIGQVLGYVKQPEKEVKLRHREPYKPLSQNGMLYGRPASPRGKDQAKFGQITSNEVWLRKGSTIYDNIRSKKAYERSLPLRMNPPRKIMRERVVVLENVKQAKKVQVKKSKAPARRSVKALYLDEPEYVPVYPKIRVTPSSSTWEIANGMKRARDENLTTGGEDGPRTPKRGRFSANFPDSPETPSEAEEEQADIISTPKRAKKQAKKFSAVFPDTPEASTSAATPAQRPSERSARRPARRQQGTPTKARSSIKGRSGTKEPHRVRFTESAILRKLK